MGSWHELEATNKPAWLGCLSPVWWINPRAKAEGRRRLYLTQLTGSTTLACNTTYVVFVLLLFGKILGTCIQVSL